MSKTLFIYDDVKPISKEKHGDWSVVSGKDWSHASETNSVPILLSEMAQAARHYPIVFTGDAKRMIPIAVLGIRRGHNSFLNSDGSWAVDYVPAFLRQYPYVFAQTGDEGKLMLCIDEAAKGANSDGKGERLFDSDGERTQYLNRMLEFAKSFQAQFRTAEQFGKRLLDLGLLEPMQAQFRMEGAKDETLSGFHSVTRTKLNDLADADLLRMQRGGMLEALYMQLFSIGNFDAIVQKTQHKPAA